MSERSRTFLLLFCLIWMAFRCSGGESFADRVGLSESPSPPSSAPAPSSSSGDAQSGNGSGASDEPVFVNGSYLTCAWSSADAGAATVTVGCQVAGPDRSAAVLGADQKVAWTVTDAAGEVIAAAAVTAARDKVTASIVLPGNLVPVATVAVAPAGSAPDGGKNADLEQALPGFDANGALAACLEQATAPPATCLATAGINIAAVPSPGSTPGPAPAPSPASPPPRTLYNGVAYYLGAAGASCTDTCSPYGGYNAATQTAIGSDGDPMACDDVLLKLASPFAVDGINTVAAGVGCMMDADNNGHQITTPATTPDAASPGVRRACACSL